MNNRHIELIIISATNGGYAVLDNTVYRPGVVKTPTFAGNATDCVDFITTHIKVHEARSASDGAAK